MAYLIDANVLLRLIQTADPFYGVAFTALRRLRSRRETLVILPQTLFEFWNVCTRPASARGGYGLSIEETDRRMRRLERRYALLPDGPAVFSEWRRLIVTCRVQGVQIHDARLVSAMYVHGITHILTFNTHDFARYPGIIVVDPASI